MTEKIFERHLSRKALVYVRQSSLHQVLHNEESRRLQYAMQQRVRNLGWSQVEVIDDDSGRTASGVAERAGFQKLVAEVCLGEVGGVAARELSRFARNSREWQQLMEVCRMVDTVLIDQEAIYDTRNANDRLLLGLKGSMSEYELDLLRLRSVEARYAKAARGEYFTKLPPGYVVRDGELELDPDARMRQTIKIVFEKALELGSARQVFEWLTEHGLELPYSIAGGVEWRKPDYGAVLRMLKNPTYAGAYFYGRTSWATSVEGPGLRRRRVRQPVDKWRAWLPDHHEGYVSWQHFERVQKMLADNEVRWGGQSGTPREGNGLVAGLLRCGRCGRKLNVSYQGPSGYYTRYSCRADGSEPGCLAFGGRHIDEAVVAQVLKVLRPAALQAAVSAACKHVEDKDALVTSLELELEKARYVAQRAQRQYDAVDPSNRLVADELERRWEAALKKATEVEQRLAEAQSNQSTSSPPSLGELCELAKDFETVWNAPSTSVVLKKRIVRTLIEDIIVDIDLAASRIDLVLHWKGGVHSRASVPKLGPGQHATDLSVDVLQVIRVLARACSDRTIAAYLTKNAIEPAKGTRWTWKKVASARNHNAIPPASKQPPGQWLTATAVAQARGIGRHLVIEAAACGLVPAEHPLPIGPWIFAAEAVSNLTLTELRRGLRSHSCKGARENPDQMNLMISDTSPIGAE